MDRCNDQCFFESSCKGRICGKRISWEVHQHVSNKLNKQFPGSDFTGHKVKSKFIQVSFSFNWNKKADKLSTDFQKGAKQFFF